MKRVACASLAAVLLTLALYGLAYLVSVRRQKRFQKRTPYECGFDPVGNARFPFSLHFFLVAILFLVFDMEIVLLYPLARADMRDLRESSYIRGAIFLIVVWAGLLYEWKDGRLDWKM